MNNTKRLSIPLTRGEMIFGWLYLPVYLVFLGTALTLVFDALGWSYSDTVGYARLNVVYFVVNFLVTILIFGKFLRENLRKIGGRFWGFVQAVILGLTMYYLGSLLVSILIGMVAPGMVNPNDQNIVEQVNATGWLMVVCTVLLVPVTEECFMRGLLFRGFHDRGRIWAYVLSVTAFSVVHMLGYVGSYPLWQLGLCLLQYVPAGIALAWAYEKADSIFAPILMHALINGLSVWVSLK